MGAMKGGRPQAHEAKLGEVGVLPEYRRRRIATSLYVACIAQTILEGRRLWTDTIVGKEAEEVVRNDVRFQILQGPMKYQRDPWRVSSSSLLVN